MKVNITIKDLASSEVKLGETNIVVEYSTAEIIAIYRALPELAKVIIAAMAK